MLSLCISVSAERPLKLTSPSLLRTANQPNKNIPRAWFCKVPSTITYFLSMWGHKRTNFRALWVSLTTETAFILNCFARFLLQTCLYTYTHTHFLQEQVTKLYCYCVGLGRKKKCYFSSFLCPAKTKEPFYCHCSSHLSVCSRWLTCCESNAQLITWLCLGIPPSPVQAAFPLLPFRLPPALTYKGGMTGSERTQYKVQYGGLTCKA